VFAEYGNHKIKAREAVGKLNALSALASWQLGLSYSWSCAGDAQAAQALATQARAT
jgi:hypothetical protein